MKRVFWSSILAVLLVATARHAGVGEDWLAPEPDALARHLRVAMSEMDPGDRSPQYRESIAFLRDHADEAIERLRPEVLDAPGSFRKWQVTYLIGELGNENAIALLRDFVSMPLPRPSEPAGPGHAFDLRYTEEVVSRFQAVASIARIASHRADLKPEVVATLVDTGREVSLVTSAAIFELRRLLGDEVEALRDHFGPEHASELDRYLPPPHWQGLLGERMRRSASGPREAPESRSPLCLN
jgi:hypothetical protein